MHASSHIGYKLLKNKHSQPSLPYLSYSMVKIIVHFDKYFADFFMHDFPTRYSYLSFLTFLTICLELVSKSKMEYLFIWYSYTPCKYMYATHQWVLISNQTMQKKKELSWFILWQTCSMFYIHFPTRSRSSHPLHKIKITAQVFYWDT